MSLKLHKNKPLWYLQKIVTFKFVLKFWQIGKYTLNTLTIKVYQKRIQIVVQTKNTPPPQEHTVNITYKLIYAQ